MVDSILILFTKRKLGLRALERAHYMWTKKKVEKYLIESNINSEQTSFRQIFEWDIEHSLIHDAVIRVIPPGVILKFKILNENFQFVDVFHFHHFLSHRHPLMSIVIEAIKFLFIQLYYYHFENVCFPAASKRVDRAVRC